MSQLAKLGGKSWSEPGLQPLSSAAVSNFQHDTQEVKVANSVGDLLQLTRQRGGRQFVGDPIATKSTTSLPKKLNPTTSKGSTGEFVGIKTAKYQNVHERPPRRVEISYLENELTQMVKTVMHPISDEVIYQPHKEKMTLVQNQIFDELQITNEMAENEPWLDGVVKSECLKDLCDEVGLRLTDMLSVSSAELGNVLRKLRYTYDQSFLQLLSSWKDLRTKYVQVDHELEEALVTIEVLNEKLNERDFNIREQIDLEIDEIKKDFEYDREQDKEKIHQQEMQMDQMTSTLKNLNAIFKTMQADVDAARTADTYARCSRLEREVSELEAQVVKAEKLRKELDEEKEKTQQLLTVRDQHVLEIDSLKLQINRRDGTIGELMERENLRNAEIEKLTRMAAQRQENDEDLDLDPVATSVLCIKCKKSLDDITSIREAILGKGKGGRNGGPGGTKLACQSFRILLPNNKGKKPFRKTAWLKACMRSILTSKMIETLSVIPMGENVTPFPSFVYSWFQFPLEFSTEHHSILHSYHQQADENRWGFYYGIKSLAKDNAEAKLFWSLLDETQGEDGLIFLCHCLSVVLSIAGPSLWKQFGSTMNHSCVQMNDEMLQNISEEKVVCPTTIWLELDTAYAAVRLILVRALESQVTETIDAIELLKCVPEVPNPLMTMASAEEGQGEGHGQAQGGEGADELKSNGEANGKTEEEKEEEEEEEEEERDDATQGIGGVEATHIDLFMWLRVMMQRFQDEQCHRHAAIRLMFDTASMGALIPTAPKLSPRGGAGAGGAGGQDDSIYQEYDNENPQVYFPQFTAVVRTLYPQMSLSEMAELYATCFVEGEGRVTAAIFTEVAGRRHLFSKSLKLGPLPLFVYDTSVSESDFETAEGGTGGAPATPGTPRSNCMDYQFDPNHSIRLRSQIGSLVHQRFALLYPEIEVLAKTLPVKWRAMVVDACEGVKTALHEYFVFMKSKKQQRSNPMPVNGNTSGLPVMSSDGSMTSKMRSASSEVGNGHGSTSGNGKFGDRYIDGLQPFIQYHRLLAMVIMVKSFNENSLLPISFLVDPDTQQQPPSQVDATSIQLNALSLKKVEKVLTSLEDSIFIHSVKNNANQKYKRFQKFRFSFFARKVQNAFRCFLTKDSCIPRALRYIIRPGYLGGGAGAGAGAGDTQQLQQTGAVAATVTASVSPLLKSRRVYLEPWILQLLVANIYAFKLTYDSKAIRMSQPLVSLPIATSSLLLMLFSSLDLVERTMHDLCLGIQTYMHGCPRLRLFASFLGFGELEEPLCQVMCEGNGPTSSGSASNSSSGSSNMMLTSYLELLALIHKEVSLKVLGKYSSKIPILFPVTEDPFTRTDKRDVWMLPLTTLTRALGHWSMTFKGIKPEIWENALTRVRRTKDGMTEVDDFLWIVMMTLGKTIANRQRKCEDQAKSITLREAKIRDYHLSSSAAPASVAPASGGSSGSGSGFVNRTASGIIADNALEEQKLHQIKFFHSVNISMIQNSLNVIHGKTLSMNDPTSTSAAAAASAPGAAAGAASGTADESVLEADLQQCCTSFIPMYSNYRHGNYRVYAKLLQQCVLWDTCSGYCHLENPLEANAASNEDQQGDGEGAMEREEEEEEKNLLANHRSSLVIYGAVPAILSLRYFSFWWNTQKDLVANEVKEIEAHLAANAKKPMRQGMMNSSNRGIALGAVAGVGSPSSRGHSFLAEMERLCTEVKRCQFRLDQILSDLSNVLLSSNFILGEMNDSETARSVEVWSLVGILFGSLSECLKLMNRPLPRDSWKAGRKLHLDRAQAYLMQVQPNINR